MRDYLMGVLCAAFVCAIVSAIGTEGKELRRILAGIFLALSLFRPLVGMDLPEFSLEAYREQAQSAAARGAEQAEEAKKEIITHSLEAYILSKAEELELQVETEVHLHQDGTPAGVTITGTAPPSERKSLIDSLSRELGLGREAFQWKDPYQSSE